ncbi:MAG: DUF4835 family protein [Muribaculaceae bacterium]|nr:DUF4835 family protein [Muribaculaceae bacterium]
MKRIKAYILTLMALLCVTLSIKAQELNCAVEINSSKIEGTDKSPFEELQEAITEYVNTQKWTNTQFAVNEKIECRMFFTINKYEDEKFTGDLQVQLSRPVYNSTYTTPLLNFKDTKIEFTHRRGEPLIYNENTWEDNLTGILNYYVYLFLALDFDSFSPLGGQPYWDRVATIVQQAQSSGETGWRAFEDTKNRSAVLSAFTDGATSGIRELMYTYHRKGLDEMVTSPDKGRAAITESLANIQTIHKNAPMSVALSIFKDTKLDELVNIYSQAPESERTDVYNLLKDIYPTETERLEKIRNPDPIR